MLLIWHSHKAVLRITRGKWSRFPRLNSTEEAEESSLSKKRLGCSDYRLITFAAMEITYILQLLALITSIACIEIQDDADHTTMSYDPADLLSKIFNLNNTTQGQSRNRFRFDDVNPGFFNINSNEESEESPTYAQLVNNVNRHIYNEPQAIYDNDNRVSVSQKKRRKQKYRLTQGFGPQYLGPLGHKVFGPDYQGSIYSPTEPPKSSFTSDTISMVTKALTSMALYDDLQCVPRLLCEAASGGALGSSQTIQSIPGLQPLLSLLSAYSGVSTNPLFVFGRAAFLGISSKNNPSSCRYAYPNCPTDPEKLVYYLNNHNGGFFRFFNAPKNGQRNIGQFYDELAQNYGNPQRVFPLQYNRDINNLYQHDQQKPNEDHELQNYGIRFPFKRDKFRLLDNNGEFKETHRIEKRIQIRPEKYLDSSDEDLNFDDVIYQSGRWSFPETDNSIKDVNYRVGKGLKFPGHVKTESDVDTFKRYPRGFVFPDTSSDERLNFNKYEVVNLSPQSENLYTDFFDYTNNKAQNIVPDVFTTDEPIRTVYVVRGNGDPRRPEVIKLRPGQSVH